MNENEQARIAETLVRDRMAYYGYTPEQIDAAENWPGHDASGCFFENWNWACTDENDKPNHPDRDELEQTAEFVMWVLENLAVADARQLRDTERGEVACGRHLSPPPTEIRDAIAEKPTTWPARDEDREPLERGESA